MKNSELIIKEIKATAVVVPLVRPITTAHAIIPAAPLVLVEVECSGGIVGRAYIFGYTPISLAPLVVLIGNLREILVGKQVAPFKLKQFMDNTFRLLGRQGFLGMAMAGLDMAFWDALGKSTGLSVARLLGGSDEAVECYDSFGIFDAKTTPNELEQSLKDGFKAVKFKIGNEDLSDEIAAIATIRDVIGFDVKLMVDYNQSLSAPEAINRLNHLEQFDIHWVEEPVPAEDFAGHAAVRDGCAVAVQTGENWWFPEDAARATAAGICDHAMLDIVKIGGVTGWMQAAAIADAAALPVSSHLFIEASAHVMTVTPRAHLLEYLDIASAILVEPYEIKNGTLIPRGPGLGIEWQEANVEKFQV